MKTTTLVSPNAYAYMLDDIRVSSKWYKKYLSRVFWVAVHAVSLVFVVSALLTYTGSTIRAHKDVQPVSSVKSAISFTQHDQGAPDPNTILELVNQKRAENNLPALVGDSRLASLAEARAQDMLARNYYAHKNPDGKIFYDLMSEQGYGSEFACENLSLEPSNVANASVDSWTKSTKGHKECMLDPSVVNAGYAAVKMYDASLNGVEQPYYLVVAIHSTEN